MLAKISVELDDLDTRVLVDHAMQDFQRAVTGTVIGKEYLKGTVRGLDRWIQTLHQRDEIALLVIDRYDYAQVGLFHALLPLSARCQLLQQLHSVQLLLPVTHPRNAIQLGK